MKTYLIDWTEKANGARYSIAIAKDKEDLFWVIDGHVPEVGWPVPLKFIEVNNSTDEGFHVELIEPALAHDSSFNMEPNWDLYKEDEEPHTLEEYREWEVLNPVATCVKSS